MATSSMRDQLRIPPGPVRLAGYDSAARIGVPVKKNGKEKKLETDHDRLVELQERLYAESTVGGTRSVLLVLQGTDTAGKGGTTEHVVGAFGPIGVRYTAFKKPTAVELSHHFLWRITREVPPPGHIGVFDRSHYEDVLPVRVHNLVPPEQWQKRYAEINRWEAKQAAAGVTIVKCFLHISYDVQRQRLLDRLDDPTKRWKFNSADLDERAEWAEYVEAYEAALTLCNTDVAPWYVIPADDKPYRNWAVAQILRETLEELDPQWPEPDLDVKRLKQRLKAPN